MFAKNIKIRAGLVFLVSFGLGSLLIYILEEKREFETRSIAKSIAASHAQSLEKKLSRSLSSTHALATVVKREFGYQSIASNIAVFHAQSLEKQLMRSLQSTRSRTREQRPKQEPASSLDSLKLFEELSKFDALAAELMDHYGGITRLQLAPMGIVKQVFPLEGSQDELGRDVSRQPSAIAARRSGKLTLEGPIALPGGEVAVLGHYPVFLPNEITEKDEFWGFASALVALPSLLDSAGFYGLLSDNYFFKLSGVEGSTGELVVYSKSKDLDEAMDDPISIAMEISSDKWILSVIPKGGWHSFSYALLEGALVLIFSGLVSLLSYRHFREAWELENQKNEYEIIFNSAPAFIIYKDLHNRVLRANRAVKDSLNMSEGSIEGKPVDEFWLGDTPDDPEIIRSGESQLGIIEPYYLTNGEVKWVQTNKVPYRDQSGKILGTLVFAIDISKQKEAENQALEYLKKLEKANKSLEEFSIIASHDLQEPLRKIIILGDRLADKISKKDLKDNDYLHRMQNAAARMQLLIDDLLKYAQLKTKLEPFRSVDINEILNEVIDDLEARLQKTKGIVEVGDLPTVEADPVQMRQLFLNLIGNALKFHRKGSPPLVKVHSSCPEEGHHIITVEDNGIGIDEAYIGKIFKPFEKLHGPSQYEGTGMGLSICDKIVTRHGGEITVQINEGDGVTFSIHLYEKPKVAEQV